MTGIPQAKKQSVSYIVYILFMSVTGVGSASWGQVSPSTNAGIIYTTDKQKDRLDACLDSTRYPTKDAREKCVSDVNSVFGTQNNSTCDKQWEKIEKSMEAAGKACANFTMGSNAEEKDLIEQARRCNRKMGSCNDLPSAETGTDQVAMGMAMVGVAMAKDTKSTVANCTLSRGDYTKNKDKVEDNISKVGDKIKKGQEDLVDLDEKYNEAIAKLQDALTKEQDIFNETKGKLDEQAQKLESDALQNSITNNDNMYKLTSQRIKIRQDMQSATSTAQAKMSAVSAQMAQADCMNKVQSARTEQLKTTSTKSKSMNNFIGTSSTAKQNLQVIFDACKRSYDQQRADIGTSLTATMESLGATLNEVDRKISEMDTVIARGATQKAAAAASIEKQKQDALTKATQNTAKLQSQLNDLKNTNAKKKAVALANLQRLSEQQAGLYNVQASLGSSPSGSVGNEKSLTDWVNAAKDGESAASDYAKSSFCCSRGDDNKLGNGNKCAQANAYAGFANKLERVKDRETDGER